MKYLLLLLLAVTSNIIFAQNVDYMDHNNTRATLERLGNFFYNEQLGTPGYEVPKNSGNHTMYMGRFYFMGLDSNGTLHASWGGDNSSSDVASGPYSSLGNYDNNYQNMWEGESWQICQEEIDIFKSWYKSCNGVNANPQDCANATIPSNATLARIYSWPAHGNVSNGEDYWLAPFYDNVGELNNQPGLYDPENGDYPIIKGCCATYRIENDAAVPHTASGTEALGIESHYQTFQYQNFGLLNDVTFVEVTVFNRGTTTYPEFVYGMYADSDLGESLDDYMGSDSLRSMYYTYNGDNNDGDYGVNPPAFGIIGLENQLSSVVPYYAGATPAEVWNLMNGLQPNGTPFLDNQNNPRKFFYGDNPNISGGWSEVEVMNAAGDRRALLSTNHGAFAPGDTIRQTYALVYTREGGNYLQNVDALYAAADEVHNFYDTIANAQCEDGVLSTLDLNKPLELQLMPNPASQYVDVVVDGMGTMAASIIDVTGKVVVTGEGVGSIRLNTSNLVDGAYFMRIMSGNSVLTSKLIIDQ